MKYLVILLFVLAACGAEETVPAEDWSYDGKSFDSGGEGGFEEFSNGVFLQWQVMASRTPAPSTSIPVPTIQPTESELSTLDSPAILPPTVNPLPTVLVSPIPVTPTAGVISSFGPDASMGLTYCLSVYVRNFNLQYGRSLPTVYLPGTCPRGGEQSYCTPNGYWVSLSEANTAGCVDQERLTTPP